MFDLDSFVANAPLIIADRDNRADVQNVLTIFAEKVGQNYVVKAKWSDIFVAFLQGKKVQAQVLTFVPADEEEETDASASVETFDIYDVSVSGGSTPSFKANGNDLSASDADSFPVGSLSRPSSGGGGGGGGGLIVNSDETGTLDKTWQEIHDAAGEGVVMLIERNIEGNVETSMTVYYLVMAGNILGEYVTAFVSGEELRNFVASSADGYPVIDMGGGGGGGIA